ncbi:hypothetical protein AGABI1DRAFT_63139 [Agaricus bisporus var. burnettii JB137-S8]|uniref:F-box domain-containing protein n=1 Tax=Agaricus bisporus var. burnettii (strain JB137-S8 / ATCC MYA-4627 / FGSC 10392) TaxID=597362 RepID=K5VPQ0_AGABU|nr:uncharacterized protein AGABI1DRAFT_63139 [Agaricus bisporus var. burnettii JB137-S8]EKM76449.1 hypothetical protein AGABI1DRAFT_63139 [Agaricus bisporus var. burnettii JB137-S8]
MASWYSLPTELKLAIIAQLAPLDVDALAKTSQASYHACVPARFQAIKLNDFHALLRFLENVPRSYCSSIETLELATHDEDLFAPTHITLRERSDAVVALLSACSRLSSLVLRVSGSLDSTVISPFPHLSNLKNLSISNVSAEDSSPLSERLVVAIAASCHTLQELSLDRVTRSELHAPDLQGVPYIPLVRGDENVPDHPLLGSDLRLPSLLRLSTLRKLTIRDTHLGDEHWSTTPVACRLQVLDLGSYYHENEDFNQSCTERIMSAVGPTVDTFSLNTAVCNDRLFAKPSETPLQKLRKLHITPFFPVDSVVETISNLAGSPIETLSMQCYEDDVVDVCNALEEFLTVKLERGSEFYNKLNRINVSVTAAGYPATEEEVDERKIAAKKLQDFCRQLRLAGDVESYGVPQRPVSSSRRASMSFAVEVATTTSVRPVGKARSMTLY